LTTAEQCYQSWLGFYHTHQRKIKWSNDHLVVEANRFATEVMRLREIPSLLPKTIGKLGLRGVPGLRIRR